jgi:hypothetical protein
LAPDGLFLDKIGATQKKQRKRAVPSSPLPLAA